MQKQENATVTGQKAKETEINIIPRKSMRKVTLKIYSGCGCGGSYVKFERMVPMDSDLQDGDQVDFMEDDDVII